MQETILLLRQQLSVSDKSPIGSGPISDSVATSLGVYSDKPLEKNSVGSIALAGEVYGDENTPKSVMSLTRVLSLEDSKDYNNSLSFNPQVYTQVIPDLLNVI